MNIGGFWDWRWRSVPTSAQGTWSNITSVRGCFGVFSSAVNDYTAWVVLRVADATQCVLCTEIRRARNENRVEQCFHNVLVLYTLFHCKWNGRVCAQCLASFYHPFNHLAQQLGSDSQKVFFVCYCGCLCKKPMLMISFGHLSHAAIITPDVWHWCHF